MKIELISNRSGVYGGLRRLYTLAQYFIEAGHTAVVNMADGSTNTWFKHSVPENQAIDPDIRIVPEVLQERHPTAKNILFYQAQWDLPQGKYDAVVTTSTYLQDILKKEGYDSIRIPYGIDNQLFYPGPKQQGLVAYMPRKNRQEAMLIRQLMPGYQYLEIENCSETEVAELLRKVDVFLAISRMEGYGIPPCEAALSGAVVVGYHGFGGRDWMTPETYVPASMPEEIAFHLQEAVNGKYEKQRQQGYNYVKTNLTPEIEKARWLEVLESI